jgi:elongation factor G
MKVEVVTPEDYMGDVMGDLNRRRGIDPGHGRQSAGKIIRAGAAVRNVRLRDDLRSQTQGRATYTMEFDHYAEVPASVAEEIIKKTA